MSEAALDCCFGASLRLWMACDQVVTRVSIKILIQMTTILRILYILYTMLSTYLSEQDHVYSSMKIHISFASRI